MLEGARLLTAGYTCMLHVHSLATMCSWDKVTYVCMYVCMYIHICVYIYT